MEVFPSMCGSHGSKKLLGLVASTAAHSSLSPVNKIFLVSQGPGSNGADMAEKQNHLLFSDVDFITYS